MSAQIKACGFCGNEFMAEKMTIKYCSPQCKQMKKKEQDHNRVNNREYAKTVDAMTIFRSIATNDAARIKKRKIISPNLSRMQFQVFDKVHKMTYYFENEENYNHFLAKQL
jgi:hypothetical protein